MRCGAAPARPCGWTWRALTTVGKNAWLIAGPFYTQRPYVMTPIPKITKKTPASPEKYYASLHSQAHAAITDVIKQLKSRWKCLETCNKQFEPGTVASDHRSVLRAAQRVQLARHARRAHDSNRGTLRGNETKGCQRPHPEEAARRTPKVCRLEQLWPTVSGAKEE
ncbi:hypothetical protein ACJJTC_014396 [Scirpophaga incertulas]